jgi:C4-dicarboxylate transporter, DctM subunit
MGFFGKPQNWVCEWFCSLLVVLTVAITLLQVITRYVFNDPLSWTEEAARIIFIWITFLGAFLALKTNSHISFGSVFNSGLSAGMRNIISPIIIALMIFYLLNLTISGIRLTGQYTESLSPALRFPVAYTFAIIPIASVLMIITLWGRLTNRNRATCIASVAISLMIIASIYFVFGRIKYSAGSLLIISVLILVVLILMNMPISFAIGGASLMFLILQGRVPIEIMPNRMVGGVDSFTLLAIPFFILAGELMNTGGITQRLVVLAQMLVGHLRGGLGMAVVVGEYFFSGISGSTVADVSAIGSLLIPAMKKAGYKAENAVAIVAAATAMGILVPPCITMVVLGAMTGISVGALFVAGFVPAVVLGLCIVAWIYIQAVREDLPVEKRMKFLEAMKAISNAIIPLMLPVIIFGGILSGAVTTTEVAVVAVIYAYFVGAVIYKEIKAEAIIPIFVKTSETTGMVLFLVGTSSVLSWIFATNDVPHKVGALVSYISTSPWVFILLCNLTFIVIGAALEGLPAMIILIPVFMPLVKQYGIDPLHFGILVVASLGIGVFIPPIGMGMFIACTIAGIDIAKSIRPFMPYLISLLVGLIIISLFPWFTLVLPNIFFPVR